MIIISTRVILCTLLSRTTSYRVFVVYLLRAHELGCGGHGHGFQLVLDVLSSMNQVFLIDIILARKLQRRQIVAYEYMCEREM